MVIALGVFVASIRPRRPQNTFFVAYSVLFGSGFLAFNLLSPDTPGKPLTEALEGVFFLGATVALLALARRHLGGDRRAGAVGLLFGLMILTVDWLLALTPLAGPSSPLTTGGFRSVVGLTLLNDCALGVSLAFAVRYLGLGPSQDRERRQLSLMALALVAYPSVVAALTFAPRGPGDELLGTLAVAESLVLAVAWLVAMTRSKDPVPARLVAWAVLALTATFLWAGTQGSYEAVASFSVGTARTLAVAVFAYAIVKYQLFDIDLKLKWTIKQSTVAAAFIAVFFIVSETAQSVFQTSLGPIMGIVAAGGLVFVLAPLQRFADGLADRALPNVKDGPEYRTIRTREVYRAAVESALEDGEITGKERTMLATLADQLGLSSREALDLEREASGAKGAA